MIIKVTNALSEKEAKKKLEEQYTNYIVNFIKKEKRNQSKQWLYWFDIELDIGE